MDSSVLCSFKVGKPKCTSEITCPATYNIAHNVHKTSRGGKHPLLLPGDDSHAKSKSRYFQFSKSVVLLCGNSAIEQQKKKILCLLHHREDASVHLQGIALSTGSAAFYFSLWDTCTPKILLSFSVHLGLKIFLNIPSGNHVCVFQNICLLCPVALSDLNRSKCCVPSHPVGLHALPDRDCCMAVAAGCCRTCRYAVTYLLWLWAV